MKSIFKKFNAKALLSTGASMAIAGAGSAAVDWALKKYDVLPATWGDTAVQIGKVIAGAAIATMVKNEIVKPVGNGIATVAAANLVEGMLPEAGETTPAVTTGLPEGTIGRAALVRLGQKGFRRINGVGSADFMGC